VFGGPLESAVPPPQLVWSVPRLQFTILHRISKLTDLYSQVSLICPASEADGQRMPADYLAGRPRRSARSLVIIVWALGSSRGIRRPELQLIGAARHSDRRRVQVKPVWPTARQRPATLADRLRQYAEGECVRDPAVTCPVGVQCREDSTPPRGAVLPPLRSAA